MPGGRWYVDRIHADAGPWTTCSVGLAASTASVTRFHCARQWLIAVPSQRGYQLRLAQTFRTSTAARASRIAIPSAAKVSATRMRGRIRHVAPRGARVQSLYLFESRLITRSTLSRIGSVAMYSTGATTHLEMVDPVVRRLAVRRSHLATNYAGQPLTVYSKGTTLTLACRLCSDHGTMATPMSRPSGLLELS